MALMWSTWVSSARERMRATSVDWGPTMHRYGWQSSEPSPKQLSKLRCSGGVRMLILELRGAGRLLCAAAAARNLARWYWVGWYSSRVWNAFWTTMESKTLLLPAGNKWSHGTTDIYIMTLAKTVATARSISLCHTNILHISSVCQLKVQLTYSSTRVIASNRLYRQSIILALSFNNTLISSDLCMQFHLPVDRPLNVCAPRTPPKPAMQPSPQLQVRDVDEELSLFN